MSAENFLKVTARIYYKNLSNNSSYFRSLAIFPPFPVIPAWAETQASFSNSLLGRTYSIGKNMMSNIKK
jgi:hypothetical protein